MPNNPRKPTYYVRMCKDGHWFFVRNMVYDKKHFIMKPVWWPEHRRGDATPYLYKTLTKARNMIDRLDLAACEVKVWSESNGVVQVPSD